ncbi:MAG TPA: FecR domain-containing protein [Spirochaetota bacterium]|mgnify:CR=1 FL=1|nr:FecR domain-containing protein [Spirochaetota bacterium]HOH37426.1 FecR domain-containing protein [Spirochaetota bacterium]HPW51980.1 FecR domain-containing protein [Spirochaetota bacterium]HPY03143.1 FecR domain-containing protein [Spirochaetota bacterium]HQA52726.1 FecR domain-containing protein [Spirochaetota bacterium]
MKKIIVMALSSVILFSYCTKKEKKYTIALSGIINFTVGDVSLKDSSGERKASVGDQVLSGTVIITKGVKSMTDIYIGENAVKIMGDSRVSFDSLIADGKTGSETVSIIVENGKTFNRIIKKLSKDDSFTVKTKTAVAAVRGTEFFVSDENGKTNVSCLDGKISVSDSKGAEVILEKNEQAIVSSDSDIVKKQIEADEINRLKILSEIKEIESDIKKKYEDQKAEIKRKYEEQKEEIQKAVTDQKEKDKQAVTDQKEGDKANVDEAKSSAKTSAGEASADAKSKMQETKPDKSNILDDIKKQKEAVKSGTN